MGGGGVCVLICSSPCPGATPGFCLLPPASESPPPWGEQPFSAFGTPGKPGSVRTHAHLCQVTERTIHPLEAHNSAAFRTSTACAAVATATDETVCSMLGRRGSLPLPLRGRALHRLFQPSSEAGAGRWVSTFPQPQPVRAPP
ncbi:uncharacterized protein [Eulemur rufifrons]|uniref:uncharacterized protein isoform X4 n=1 Tax=Eulemur rufifrons TaxID=859984 RepID=UPI00374358ED